MVEFAEIDESNFYDVIALEVKEEQSRFVAPNVKSIAECYLYRNDNDVFPYAIQDDEKIVGFILIDLDEEAREFMIWRMMIDKKYQHSGYGRATVEKAIEMAQKEDKYDTFIADYVKGNDIMGEMLESMDFINHSFDDENNEYVMHYKLN
ncbi:GNAT family N-acetyltransferase [Salinicoccus hispanicus]|uniref:GNAT family N-acetyltransferase n=1 Tax=Salinicoccus hispanicus TaxID=157225 RepID=A0A6N8TXF5_9STAP|nr:GNAT family N-acetyltransferase [Salinicoccus hispanicus]MXQ50122.1 GNAT family N-acetyltransferase [Salinicoccus hispanicus]